MCGQRPQTEPRSRGKDKIISWNIRTLLGFPDGENTCVKHSADGLIGRRRPRTERGLARSPSESDSRRAQPL